MLLISWLYLILLSIRDHGRGLPLPLLRARGELKDVDVGIGSEW